MPCAAGQHDFSGGELICRRCGSPDSRLAQGGLPGPGWQLLPGEPAHTPRSVSAWVRAQGQPPEKPLLLREYLPPPGAEAPARLRRFVETARSLRDSPIPAMRVLFPYTRGPRAYTVAELVQFPLRSLAAPAHSASEARGLEILRGLLHSLATLHAASAAAGPLFHGDLRLENVIPEHTTGPGFALTNSLYLEQLLLDSSLPPEHFQEADLRAAAEIVLTLTAGTYSPGQSEAFVGRLNSPALGGTLEYLLGTHGSRAGSARAALVHLQLLERAAAEGRADLFREAYAVSPSPRFAPPAPTVPTPPPPQPKPPAPPPVPEPVATGWAEAPFVPPPPPEPPSKEPERQPVSPPPRRGCRGCLFAFLLVGLTVFGIWRVAQRLRQHAPEITFSASPNPVPRGQPVMLSWYATGCESMRLNGESVVAIDSRQVTPAATTSYHLTCVAPDGRNRQRDLTITVLSRRAKPRAGAELAPIQPQTGTPEPQHAEAPAPAPVRDTIPPPNTPQEAQTTPAPVVRKLPDETLAELQGTMQGWSNALLSHDPARIASFYAPQVERYFLRTGTDRAGVEQELRADSARGERLLTLNFSEIHATPAPDDSVVIRFHKDFTLQTPGGTVYRTAHSILHLRKLDGIWKITFERDFTGPNPPA